MEKFLVSHPTGYFPFAKVEADNIEAKDTSAASRDGDGDDDADMQDFEEMGDFPLDHTPGWADPTSFREDDIDGLLVLIKGGMMKRSRVVPVEVSAFHRHRLITRHWNSVTGLWPKCKSGSLWPRWALI